MSALLTPNARQSTRRVRRKVLIGTHLYVVEFSAAGISFREYRHRFTISLPWAKALATAEHLAGDAAWRRRELERRVSQVRRGKGMPRRALTA